MTLAGVVAEARRELAAPDETVREEAAGRLARLAAAGVPGADPEQWWALVGLSDDRPVRAPGETVRVSPSKIEDFHTCGLRWLLQSSGGSGPAIGSSTLGTLVHEIAQEFADGDREGMHTALDERWPRLGLGTSWISRTQLERAHLMISRLRDYLDGADAAGWRGHGVEERFSAVVGRAKLSGSIDRVERRADGTVRVIDYKTGRSSPTKAEMPAHAQLAAYQVAVEAGGLGEKVTNGGAALVQLGSGQGTKPTAVVQEQPPLTDDADGTPTGPDAGESTTPGEPPVGSRRWALDLVARTADGMGDATFTAAINERCQTCSVTRSCPLQPEGRTLS